jgi:hypothetical protein
MMKNYIFVKTADFFFNLRGAGGTSKREEG